MFERFEVPILYKILYGTYITWAISTNRPPVPHSRVGWIKPITEEHFNNLAKIP